MESLGTRLEALIGLSSATQRQLLASLLIFLAVLLARSVALRLLRRRITDVRIQYRWRRGVTYGATILTLLLVGRVWFAGLGSIATFLGLVSAGLAVAMHETISNLTGWVFILWRRPFVVGDRVEIGGVAGDVIDVRLFQFSLLEIGNWVDADQSTGRIVHMPNGTVLRERLANYTKGFNYIWDEIGVLVTFESDWKKAKRLLAELATTHTQKFSADAEKQIRAAAEQYMIFYGALTPIVYTSVKDSGVMLTLRYLVQPRQRRGVRQALWESVLEGFAAADDLDFAYPTTRFYDNRGEGKPGTGGTRA